MTTELTTEKRYPPPCKTCGNKIIHRILHNLYCQRTSARNFNWWRDYWILMEEKDMNLRFALVEDGAEITIILKNYNERASEKEWIKLNKWEVGMEIVAIHMDTRRKLIHFMCRRISKPLEKRRITWALASYINLLGEGTYGCVYLVETYQRLPSTNDTDATTETNRDERILKISPLGQNLCKLNVDKRRSKLDKCPRCTEVTIYEKIVACNERTNNIARYFGSYLFSHVNDKLHNSIGTILERGTPWKFM